MNMELEIVQKEATFTECPVPVMRRNRIGKFNMKIKLTIVTAGLAVLQPSLFPVHAQGTAFTYQGRLEAGGGFAGGRYDFAFSLYGAGSGGIPLAGPVTNTAVMATNGLFTTVVDFGAVFAGASNWLQIAVSTNGANAFTTLAPRQQLTPVPYAITAENVAGGGIAGSYTNAITLNNSHNNFTGTFTGNGAELTNVNAAALDGLNATNFWLVGGNVGANPANGAYLGTQDELPVEIWANGTRVLQLEYATDSFYGQFGISTANLIGGCSANVVSNGYGGSFIGGGGNSEYPNTIGGSYASVVGGMGNTASGWYSVAMGEFATASGGDSVSIGEYTTASDYNTAAMGYWSTAGYPGDFVWADTQYANYAATGPNQFLIRAQGGVGINITNAPAAALEVASPGSLSAPQLRLDQQANDYARIRLAGFTNAVWDVAVADTMNFWASATGLNVLVLNPNGNASFAGAVFAKGVQLTSDRNAKENFTALNPQSVLAKVSALPVTEWNYKSEPADQKHIGPMAQDFQAAFGLNGGDDQHISVVDEGGVALAAIQGLSQELAEQKAENAKLKARLEKLEQLINQKPGGGQ
jgi:hypothetical protein